MSAPEEKSTIKDKGSKESKKNTDAKVDSNAQDANGEKNAVVTPDDIEEANVKNDSAKTQKSADNAAEQKFEETKAEVIQSGEKPEAKRSDEKLETKKSKSKKSVANEDVEDILSMANIIEENLFKELMSKAEQKSKGLKLNMISQMSEVFRLFDIDRDGVIGEMDLKYTFSSLGEINVSEEKIRNILNECPSPIDFNAFVGLFESKEMEFDSELDLVKAFSTWDNQKSGMILEKKIKDDLMRKGDRFSEKDADRALEEAPIYDEEGNPTIDYIEFCTNICGLQNMRKSELFQEKYSRSSFKK